MAQERRSTHSTQIRRDLSSGPYLARIVSHLDPSFMGSLEVVLLREAGNTTGDETQTYIVKCASPFFGYTTYEYMGKNSAVIPDEQGRTSSTEDAYNDTQKSYGMWMVPPDVGVTVLVVFVEGDPGQGFWIGCIPANFANNMVPGIAGSTEVDYDADDRLRFNTKQPLPVAEINKKLNTNNELDPRKIKKPLHPIAERFLEQGLVEDDVRGTTNSSARRELPSMVFGISTPGPVDRRPGSKKSVVGTRDHQQASYISRLGGTQFVMDDGDERFQRKTPASQGPVEYADVLAGEKGDPTLPYNEHCRIRTRTGHQILMHNTEDLIYIGNSRGTTWIEMTSLGKIDIYAQDSVSIHTEADFNLLADRDFNIEAGRNFNIKSGGKTHIQAGDSFFVLANNQGKLSFGQTLDIVSGSDAKITSAGKIDVGANGNITVSAPRVDINGPLAAAAEASPPIEVYPNPSTSTNIDWSVNRYQSGIRVSAMKRAPMHEPWTKHENFSPGFLSSTFTDSTLPFTDLAPNAIPGSNPGIDPASIAPAPGTLQEREIQAMDYFISVGYTPEQAAGIVGNLIAESNLNPNAIARNDAGPGRDSEGVAQWNRDRLLSLKKYADSKGAEYKDYQIQLEFVHVELSGSPSGYTRERTAQRELLASTRVEDATLAITKYERFQGYQLGFASTNTQKRIAYSKRVLEQYQTRPTEPPPLPEPREA